MNHYKKPILVFIVLVVAVVVVAVLRNSSLNRAGLIDITPKHAEIINPVLDVAIDIQPNDDKNLISLSDETIEIAMLSTDMFNAASIDPDSIKMGAIKGEIITRDEKHACREEDTDSDTLVDLVCQIYLVNIVIETDTDDIWIETETFNGKDILGEDSIRIISDE